MLPPRVRSLLLSQETEVCASYLRRHLRLWFLPCETELRRRCHTKTAGTVTYYGDAGALCCIYLGWGSVDSATRTRSLEVESA